MAMMLALALALPSISGVVADPAGAPLAHASVVVYDVARNVVAQAESGADGTFRAMALRPGVYTVLIRSGYAVKLVNDVEVRGRVSVGKLELDLGGCE